MELAHDQKESVKHPSIVDPQARGMRLSPQNIRTNGAVGLQARVLLHGGGPVKGKGEQSLPPLASSLAPLVERPHGSCRSREANVRDDGLSAVEIGISQPSLRDLQKSCHMIVLHQGKFGALHC